MHAKFDVVLLATADWDATVWTNKQHVALALNDLGARVLYVESLGLRMPKLDGIDIARIFRRLGRLFQAPKEVRRGIWRWSPPSIPLQKYRVVRLFNRLLISAFLRFWTNRLLGSNLLLWTYNPMTLDLIRPVASKVIYHCVDDIASQPGMPSAEIRQSEAKLVAQADYVSVTSLALLHKWRDVRDVSYYPNCVDANHFSRQRGSDPLAGIPQPRIGFVGTIAEYKMDGSLLLNVFSERPDWNLVLVGPVETLGNDLAALLELPNVHHIGPHPYEELPSYIQNFNVGIIPSRINAYTRSMFPMKFFEYQASGIPVVATRLPSLVEFAHTAYLGEEHEFKDLLELAIRDGVVASQETLNSILTSHSYRSRTLAMLDDLSQISGIELMGEISC